MTSESETRITCIIVEHRCLSIPLSMQPPLKSLDGLLQSLLSTCKWEPRLELSQPIYILRWVSRLCNLRKVENFTEQK